MGALGFSPSLACYEALCAAYSEKHRFYHTCTHIDAMLSHFDAVKDQTERPAELELAIWFHDAIYRIFSGRNELDSADWARTFMCSQGAAPETADRVCDLILATRHDQDVRGTDQEWIVDIDLAILGAPAAVYEAFEANVRREYRLIPAFIYRKKRKRILQSFLDRPSLYRTGWFRDRYESRARDNINRALAAL